MKNYFIQKSNTNKLLLIIHILYFIVSTMACPLTDSSRNKSDINNGIDLHAY